MFSGTLNPTHSLTRGKLCEMFAIVTSSSYYDSDNTDIFLNQLIQFSSNNATNLHHLTSHSIFAVLPHNKDRIVTTDYCNVSSCADTEWEGQGACPLEANVQILPLQKSVETKAGKHNFKIPIFSFKKFLYKKIKSVKI